MNQKVSLGVTISIAAIVCAVTFILTSFFSLRSFNEKVQAVKEKAEKYERLEALDTYIREHYYTDIDEDSVADGILKGYVSGLGDRYSSYLTPEEYAALMEKESGKTVGIGVTVIMNEDGLPLIIEVVEKSPAESAGIAAGDVITAVDGASAAELGYQEAIDRIRGEEDSQLLLTVLRDGAELTLAVTRHTFDLVSVSGSLLEGNVGYISITAFRDNSPEQFRSVLNELLDSGAQALIFDVRDNGGGLLSALEEIADPLLPEGVIATATYQGGRTETVMTSDAEVLDLPMVVLVNGSTASAAELFAASLRDFSGAKLVGTQTYGKGVMQSTSRMDDGGGLTLTIATYQTTVSPCYHGVGLAPDVAVEAGDAPLTTAPDPAQDPQLAAAVAELQDLS